MPVHAFTSVTSSDVLWILGSNKTLYSEHCLQLKWRWLREKFRVATFLIRNLCSKTLALLIYKVAIFMKRSKGSFIYDFCQLEKLWNHLCYSRIRKAGQKSSHHVNLCRPDWKILHIKEGWKSSLPVFYLDPALI